VTRGRAGVAAVVSVTSFVLVGFEDVYAQPASRQIPVAGGAHADRCVDPNANISFAVGSQTLSSPIVHDSTLAGDGSSDSPLGLALPLDISAVAATDSTAVLTVTNTSTAGYGVLGVSSGAIAVIGQNMNGLGVMGISVNSYGVYGTSSTAGGVWGSSPYGPGVYGEGAVGVYAHNGDSHHDAYLASQCCAGDFYGDVYVHGTLTKTGGSFKIDHPLDPANKYLSHSFVESPDMKNIYDGIAVLDKHGEAVVQLPDWFEALNHDFRYQLTAIGAPAPRLYIAKEIRDGRFTIAGGKAGTKISWQVTGTRHDAWADANRILTEEDKPPAERGYYLHPEVFGEPADMSVGRALHHAVVPKQ
jgi:hypothetical protein